MVAADIEDFELLQMKVTIQSLNEHILWCKEDVERSWSEGDSWIKLEVHDHELSAAEIWAHGERGESESIHAMLR